VSGALDVKDANLAGSLFLGTSRAVGRAAPTGFTVDAGGTDLSILKWFTAGHKLEGTAPACLAVCVEDALLSNLELCHAPLTILPVAKVRSAILIQSTLSVIRQSVYAHHAVLRAAAVRRARIVDQARGAVRKFCLADVGVCEAAEVRRAICVPDALAVQGDAAWSSKCIAKKFRLDLA